MGVSALGIEHPLDMTVQRLRDRDPRQHRSAAMPHQHQRLDCDLRFRQVGFLFRQAGDVFDVVGGSRNVMSSRLLGSGIGSSNSRCQPLAVIGVFLTKRGGGRART